MKRKAFRLEPVLRIRRMEERAAALASAQAVAEATASVQRADSFERAADEATLPMTSSATAFVAAMISARTLAADASAARSLAIAKTEQAETVRESWTAAAQRTKGLERLRERHVEAVQAADDHAEARTVDDLVTRQYAVRSQGGGQD